MNDIALVSWLRQLDGLLRGEATRLSALRRGAIDISADGITIIIIALGVLYGACMGCYALFQTNGPSALQFASTVGKVPALFLLTMLVTFPSLYVFNALVGSRLSFLSIVRLIVATVAIMVAVLASFGPIVAFFSVSTTSYPFMLLLNVLIFAVSGFLGLKFLLFTLHRLTLAQEEADAQRLSNEEQTVVPRVDANGQPLPPRVEPAGALDKTEGQVLGRNVTTVFYIWMVVFGLVGAQMSWVLRPFLGHPDRPFMLFAARESNFFEAVLNLLGNL